jgi:hypothetical protein
MAVLAASLVITARPPEGDASSIAHRRGAGRRRDDPARVRPRPAGRTVDCSPRAAKPGRHQSPRHCAVPSNEYAHGLEPSPRRPLVADTTCMADVWAVTVVPRSTGSEPSSVARPRRDLRGVVERTPSRTPRTASPSRAWLPCGPRRTATGLCRRGNADCSRALGQWRYDGGSSSSSPYHRDATLAAALARFRVTASSAEVGIRTFKRNRAS